jgi:tetratricopeptide (TPR) repeat protein
MRCTWWRWCRPRPTAQIAVNRRVVAYAQNAADPRARRWDAAALNNIGSTLNEAGRHAEALDVLRQAQAAYERQGRTYNVRVARWMVAHTLRRMGRLDEALQLQRALEADWAAAGGADPYVFDEIAEIHAARGDADRAAHYRALAAKVALTGAARQSAQRRQQLVQRQPVTHAAFADDTLDRVPRDTGVHAQRCGQRQAARRGQAGHHG